MTKSWVMPNEGFFSIRNQFQLYKYVAWSNPPQMPCVTVDISLKPLSGSECHYLIVTNPPSPTPLRLDTFIPLSDYASISGSIYTTRWREDLTSPIVSDCVVFYSIAAAQSRSTHTILRNYCIVWAVLCLAVVMLVQHHCRNILTCSKCLGAWVMHVSVYTIECFCCKRRVSLTLKVGMYAH